jgi:hypothetical protein
MGSVGGLEDGVIALQAQRNNAIISRRRTVGGRGSVQRAAIAGRTDPDQTINDMCAIQHVCIQRIGASQGICD